MYQHRAGIILQPLETQLNVSTSGELLLEAQLNVPTSRNVLSKIIKIIIISLPFIGQIYH